MLRTWLQLVQFVLIIQAICPSISETDYMVVKTKMGPVRGKMVTHDDEPVYQFLAIPYAKPPMGTLRFSKPQPLEPWKDNLDATRHPPACMHVVSHKSNFLPTVGMSEDCLFLSIFVPFQMELPDSKAVIVLVNGGDYMFGQSSLFDGSHLAINGDVIVVTVNYRLGIFGFLLGNSLIKGNYGLWDQRLAFEWVKANIGAFGGNPSFITIFGEATGGISVSLHSVIPTNEGLFQRVISHGGVAISPLAMSKDSENVLLSLKKILNCSGTDTEFMSCLRNRSAEVILKVSLDISENKWKNWELIPLFKPCIDDELITDEPRLLLSDTSSDAYKFFRSLDIIIGTTDKAGYFTHNIGIDFKNIDVDKSETLSSTVLCDNLSPSISAAFFSNSSKVSKTICELYKADSEHLAEQGSLILDMVTDFMFHAPAVEMLNIHAKDNTLRRSYQYLLSGVFNHSLSSSDIPRLTASMYGTELTQMFDMHNFTEKVNSTIEEDEYDLSEQMVLYWGNFAKSGNLNSASLLNWPQYVLDGDDHHCYINFSSTVSQGRFLYSDRVKFWLEDIPNILHPKHHIHDEL